MISAVVILFSWSEWISDVKVLLDADLKSALFSYKKYSLIKVWSVVTYIAE